MKTLGLRDIIGPIMVGPSSSHTAGALAIARMARRLCGTRPKHVTFTLHGSFAHTGTRARHRQGPGGRHAGAFRR